QEARLKTAGRVKTSVQMAPQRPVRKPQAPAPTAKTSIAATGAATLQYSVGGTCSVLMIRLSRIGKKKKPYYRVVVIERTRPRNGRVVEAVGTYDPLKKPALLQLDAERIKHWLSVGAQPSDTVRSFISQQKIA